MTRVLPNETSTQSSEVGREIQASGKELTDAPRSKGEKIGSHIGPQKNLRIDGGGANGDKVAAEGTPKMSFDCTIVNRHGACPGC